jgi:hypothetical protein
MLAHRDLRTSLLVSALFLIPAIAAGQRPRTVLIVTGGLSWPDVESGRFPALRKLAQRGAVALLNTSVKGARTPSSALYSLLAGQRLSFDEPDDGSSVVENRLGRLGGAYAALDDQVNPWLWANHMDPSEFEDFNSEFVKRFRGGQAFWPRPPPSILATYDGSAVILFSAELVPGHEWTLDRLIAESASKVVSASDRLVVVSAWPRPVRDGKWDRLGFVIAYGASIERGLLTSATTRTEGLVANVDVLPTLLAWTWKPPLPGSEGRPFEEAPRDGTMEAIRSLDRVVHANDRALVPHGLLMAGIVVLAFAAWAGRQRSAKANRTAAFLLLSLLAWPLALIVSPLLLAWIPLDAVKTLIFLPAAISALIAFAATLAIRSGPRRLLAILGVSSLVFVADGISQGALIRFSMLSGFQIQGIRYYGIGNEYMGILLGMALALLGLCGLKRWYVAALGLPAIAALGWPGFGADAGGLVAAFVAFGCAYLVACGRRCRWLHAALLAAVGIACALLFAWIESRLAGSGASHLGQAILSEREDGMGSLVALVAGKVGMHARILVHPATIAGLCALALILFAARSKGQPIVELTTQRYPGWGKVLAPAGWGGLAALVFNDSGVVSALMMLGVVIVAGMFLSIGLMREPAGPPLGAGSPPFEHAGSPPSFSGSAP